MKKLVKIVIIAAALLATAAILTTCKQFLEDPEEFFSYWAAEVAPADFSFDKPAQTSAAGALCIPSKDDVTLTVNLRNPKNFSLVMPASAADAGAIIRFPYLDPQPVYGTDYTLRQAGSTLTLVYKNTFLKRHEWSTGNIGVEISLISTDGRTFGKRFSANVQANTAPSLVKAGAGIGKTLDGGKWYYVLIFRAEDMDLKIDSGPFNGQYVHKDIKQLHLTKEGSASTGYNIRPDFPNKKFTADGPSPFPAGSIAPLAAGDWEGPPPALPSGDWLIYIKTDVEVSASSAAKTYTAQLSDEAGLFSAKADASTAKRKVGDIQIGETYPIGYHHASTENGQAATPYKVTCDEHGVTLEATCNTPGVTVSYTVYDVTNSPPVQKGKGSGASPLGGIQLPAPLGAAGTEVKYKVVLKATAPGFTENTREVYYTLKRAGVKTINGDEHPHDAWQLLKETVANAQDGDIIIIQGTILATNAAGNNDQITVNKNLTIRGKKTDRTDTLNANCNHDGTPPSGAPTTNYRIFDVQGSKTLTLENLTLKNGKKEGALGGCIFVPSGKVELTNCIIENCTAGDGGAIGVKGEAKLTNTVIKKCAATSTGGAICTKSGKVTMTNCTLTGNSAKNGGAIAAQRDTTPSAASPNVTISGGTIGGTAALDANKASKSGTDNGNGGGIWINNGTLTLNNNAKVTGNTAANKGGGIYTEGGTVTMTGGTVAQNKAVSVGGGIYAQKSGTMPAAVTITGGIIEANTATDGVSSGSGGGIYIDQGCTLTIQGNAKIKDNEAKVDGGGIYTSGTVTVDQCTITGNKADTGNGGGVCAIAVSGGDPCTVTITGGTIGGTNAADANKATGTGSDDGGGGIYVGSGCTLTMQNNAEVIGNTAIYNGAGIYTKGTLTMESCTITDNKTTGADNDTGGGGVYVKSGSVEIKDATKIYHNYTDALGGGIYVNDGTVTLKNATIGGEQLYDGTDPDTTKGNKAQYCGGIYVENGTITMENCTLSSNTALNGGGIQADNGNLTVKDCILTNNEADLYGGGIYVKGGTFTMENCTITDNKTTGANNNTGGGGVYVEGGTFKMKGSSRITPSTGGDANVAGKNDVYLHDGAKITVDSVLTGTAPVARITVPNDKYLTSTQVLTGSAVSSEHGKFTVTPNGGQNWSVGNNGYLKTP